jgi:hypothetical protein
VVRENFMHYYSQLGLAGGAFATQGFNGLRTYISENQQLEPAVVVRDGLAPLGEPLPNLSADAANDTDPDFIPDTGKQPRYRYAAVNIERKLPDGMTLRLGGSLYRGKDLLVGGAVAGINAIALDALAHRDQLNDESFRRTLRPFPQFQQFNTAGQFPLGRYRYESGFVSLEKRAARGLTFDMQYQLRKSRDDYTGPGVQDYFNLDNEWSLTRGARPQIFTLTYVYELPFGAGKPILNNSKVIGSILGNWSVSGYTRWYSGDPISLQPEFNNTGQVVPYLRVQSVAGVDAHVASPSPAMWFNPDAFVNPDDFTIGDVSRTHPSLRNPGFNNHDISVTKRVPISSERSLEILFEGYNFLNHANWNEPDATIGAPEARNANAGKIIGSRGGRVVQMGLRFNF